MRGAIAILRREILERRHVLIAAAAAGLVPFLVALVRGLHGSVASDARRWTAVILAAAFAAGVSVALGLTTLAGEMVHRRISFYWSRPVSGPAIWAGKLLGAWLLAILTAALVLLPTFLIDRMPTLAVDFSSDAPAILVLGALGVTVLAHAAAIVVRSRTVLLVADCIGLALAYLLLRFIGLPLLRLGAGGAALNAIRTVHASVAIGILIGGAAAVMIGRTEIRAAHRALSKTLWVIVGLGIAVAGAYTYWVAAASSRDVSSIVAVEPGSGSWVTVEGEARTAFAMFALNADDGRSARMPALFRPAVFAQQGSRAIWLGYEGRDSLSLISWSPEVARSRPATSPVRIDDYPSYLFLSPDGTRVGSYRYDASLVSIYDLDTGRLLASARLPGALEPHHAVFTGPDRLRLFVGEQAAGRGVVDVLDFDVPAKKLRRVVRIDGTDPYVLFWIRSDARQLVARNRLADRLAIYDAESGRETGTLLDEPGAGESSFCFLSNGRIAVIASEGRRIRIVTSDGQIEKELPLPTSAWTILGEPRDGYLTLQLKAPDTASVVDLRAGSVRQVSGLRPALSLWVPRSNPATVGAAAALFLTTPGTLVRLDPVTLERTVIIGRGRK